jgi:hypothetical protein
MKINIAIVAFAFLLSNTAFAGDEKVNYCGIAGFFHASDNEFMRGIAYQLVDNKKLASAKCSEQIAFGKKMANKKGGLTKQEMELFTEVQKFETTVYNSILKDVDL